MKYFHLFFVAALFAMTGCSSFNPYSRQLTVLDECKEADGINDPDYQRAKREISSDKMQWDKMKCAQK